MVHELSIYQGDSIQVIEAIKLQASISPLGLTVNNVALQKGEQQLALQGEIAAAFPYPIKLNIHWQSTLNDKQQLRGEGSVSGNLHTLNIQHQLLSPYVLHTKGELALAVDDAVMQIDPDTISVDIHNQWPQTRIAVGADDSLQSQGQLDIKGRFDRYVLSFNSRLAAQQKNGTAPQNNGAAPTKATPTNPPESLVQTALAKPSHISINVQGNKRYISLHKAVIEKSASRRIRQDGVIVLLEDLTETELLEEELAHSERLASIGRLAAGVAHEIGNPITGIACLAQNIRDETQNDELRTMARQIIEQTDRTSRIVQSLVNFAHSGSYLSLIHI